MSTLAGLAKLRSERYKVTNAVRRRPAPVRAWTSQLSAPGRPFELELDCEVLLTPEHDQRVILHTAPPGTETAEKLELLRIVGLQQLVPENHSLMADS